MKTGERILSIGEVVTISCVSYIRVYIYIVVSHYVSIHNAPCIFSSDSSNDCVVFTCLFCLAMECSLSFNQLFIKDESPFSCVRCPSPPKIYSTVFRGYAVELHQILNAPLSASLPEYCTWVLVDTNFTLIILAECIQNWIPPPTHKCTPGQQP